MILIINNYDSFTYNLYQEIAAIEPDVRIFRNDEITLDEVVALNPNGVILSPGPGRPESAGICIELILNLTAHIPILGVCLGLQAIVKAFGGDVIHAPTVVHGKSEHIFHKSEGIYQNLPLPFAAARYHSLIADRLRLPDNLIIEAENAQGLIMGVRHINRPIYGVQFHPESILTPMGHYLLHDFVRECGLQPHQR